MENKKLKVILEKARIAEEKDKELRSSESYKNVVSLLSGLKFLISPDIKPSPLSKVDIDEVIRAGTNIDLRILEVLPAAIISSPRSFIGLDRLPRELKGVVRALKGGREGPSYGGISFEKFFEAASRDIKDGKRKPVGKRKVSKTFRFSPEVIALIDKKSREHGLSNTAVIEKVLLGGL